MQDPNEIKEKIISTLKSRGPSLPVHIAGEIKSSILFSSAFLGELLSEKRVKISYMKVGSSPLYFLTGQEAFLENFSQYLKSKEKDAFLILKEKKFLKDSAQNPAIRVALREIRDFAIPFKSGEEIFWRYFLVPESEFKVVDEEKPIKLEKPAEIIREKSAFVEEKKLEIKPKVERKIRKKKLGKENKFFDDIKGFLSANSINLLDIKSFGRKEIILKVKEKNNEKESLLIAYNKNKINESDIVKASKKASKEGLPYMVLGLSEPAKKTSELIKAMKDLSFIRGLK